MKKTSSFRFINQNTCDLIRATNKSCRHDRHVLPLRSIGPIYRQQKREKEGERHAYTHISPN